MPPILQPVLLSGGSGTRLWPLSREAYPKQFLPLVGPGTMLQETWQRVAPLTQRAPIVVANEDHRFLVAEQLRQLGVEQPALLLEPTGRNTAPAIAAAAMQAMREGDDAVLLVLPSDHAIADAEGFRQAVNQALPAARDGALVTFGIMPTAPETGFGYIQADAHTHGDGVRKVLRFVEKPDAATARGYLDAGGYYWNSGMFLFRASRFIEELRKFRPDIEQAARQALLQGTRDGDFVRLQREAFEACPSESIDYAVMEKTDAAMVLPVNIGWNDVGSWSALWEVSEQDTHGNAFHGEVVAVDSCGNYVHAQRLVALVGVENAVVVETDDAILVADKTKVQQVKDVVARLKREVRSQAVLHREVHRPWGSYDSVDVGPGFQVKRIKVKPGAKLSLQSHTQRAEHWIVVRGTARVTRDNDVFELFANQSTYIPIGAKHRLENPGDSMLELIEVQSGDYLGEDDIVRYDDVYGRTQA